MVLWRWFCTCIHLFAVLIELYISDFLFIRKPWGIACRFCTSSSHSAQNHITTKIFRFSNKSPTYTSSYRKHSLDCTSRQSCLPLSPRSHSSRRVWVPHPSTSSFKQIILKYTWHSLWLLLFTWTRPLYKKQLSSSRKPYQADHHDGGSPSYSHSPTFHRRCL